MLHINKCLRHGISRYVDSTCYLLIYFKWKCKIPLHFPSCLRKFFLQIHFAVLKVPPSSIITSCRSFVIVFALDLKKPRAQNSFFWHVLSHIVSFTKIKHSVHVILSFKYNYYENWPISLWYPVYAFHYNVNK